MRPVRHTSSTMLTERMAAMSIVPAPPGPTHELPGTRFTSLATPSRGSAETAVWTVEIDPGTPVTPHSLTREEVFVVLDGAAALAPPRGGVRRPRGRRRRQRRGPAGQRPPRRRGRRPGRRGLRDRER